jgi:hypothetical protein
VVQNRSNLPATVPSEDGAAKECYWASTGVCTHSDGRAVGAVKFEQAPFRWRFEPGDSSGVTMKYLAGGPTPSQLDIREEPVKRPVGADHS